VSRELAALLLFAVCELLVGLGLRSEALASRARAEAALRRAGAAERRAEDAEALWAVLTAPARLEGREPAAPPVAGAEPTAPPAP